MPKWTEYTSKDTLADNDEVMLYDATARANKRGLMSKFWDYVVDKMATAVISKLETNNKTIIGAINALNSECSKIIIAEKKNGIFTATFNIYRSAGYKSAMVFSTDGTNGFFHLVLIPPTTTQCEYITVWEHNENTISYTYDFSTGTLTLKSTGIIYGGITCICGL